MNYYFKVFKQYADFNGRARRKEYWMFYLIQMLISLALSISILYQFINSISNGSSEGMLGTLVIYLIMIIYGIGSFIPALAVSVRRLHDIGRSGLWLFIYLIPIVGFIWLLILCVTPGNIGDNLYGPDPKEIENKSFDM